MINKLVLVPCKYTQKTGSNNFLAKKIAWRQGTFCIFYFFFREKSQRLYYLCSMEAGKSGNSGQSGESGKSGKTIKPQKKMMPTPDEKHPHIQHYADGTASVMRKVVVYTELRFYKRSDVLYQLTQVFCQRYLPRYGDRTVDQMVQAARSTKQNIAEGSTDGQTSTETELKLLGIARGSNQELLEDYQDYLKRKGMTEWFGKNDRFDRLHRFCQEHTRWDDYRPLTERMNDEELANMAICLCHQVDKAMTKYIERKDREFTTEGGIRERMTAARLNQRETQRQTIERQAAEIAALRKELARLRALLAERG